MTIMDDDNSDTYANSKDENSDSDNKNNCNNTILAYQV